VQVSCGQGVQLPRLVAGAEVNEGEGRVAEGLADEDVGQRRELGGVVAAEVAEAVLVGAQLPEGAD